MMSEKLISIYNAKKVNSTNIWLAFIFLGWSYGSMDKVGKQVLFYLSFGGFAIWTLIRLFTLNSAIKESNRNIAMEIGLEDEDIKLLGLI